MSEKDQKSLLKELLKQGDFKEQSEDELKDTLEFLQTHYNWKTLVKKLMKKGNRPSLFPNPGFKTFTKKAMVGYILDNKDRELFANILSFVGAAIRRERPTTSFVQGLGPVQPIGVPPSGSEASGPPPAFREEKKSESSSSSGSRRRARQSQGQTRQSETRADTDFPPAMKMLPSGLRSALSTMLDPANYQVFAQDLANDPRYGQLLMLWQSGQVSAQMLDDILTRPQPGGVSPGEFMDGLFEALSSRVRLAPQAAGVREPEESKSQLASGSQQESDTAMRILTEALMTTGQDPQAVRQFLAEARQDPRWQRMVDLIRTDFFGTTESLGRAIIPEGVVIRSPEEFIESLYGLLRFAESSSEPQWEMPPEQQAQLIPAGSRRPDGSRSSTPPEDIQEEDGKLDPPEFGEEKQPDFANQVDQNPAVGFQQNGIPDQGDLTRVQRLVQLRRIFPEQPESVLQNMVDNSDFGSLEGRREDLAEEEIKEAEARPDSRVRTRESLGRPISADPERADRMSSQAQSFLAQLTQQSRIRPTGSTGVRATNSAWDRVEEKLDGNALREAQTIRDAVEEVEERNPGLTGRVGVIAAQIYEQLPRVPATVRSAIPWLALNIAGLSFGLTQPTKPGRVQYSSILSLIATLASVGYTVPGDIEDFAQQAEEDIEAGRGGDGGEEEEDLAGSKVQRPRDRPPAGGGPFEPPGPEDAEGVPIDENLRDRLAERYGIPRDGDVPRDAMLQAGRELGPRGAADVIDFVQRGVKAGILGGAVYAYLGGPGGPLKPPGGAGPTPSARPPNPGDVRERPVQVTQQKFVDDDPTVGDLRPTFELLGTEADTETPEEAIAEQFKFASFRHVPEGHGNGPKNPLYLQQKAWDNMVRFVNNFVPAVDRLSREKMVMFDKPNEMIPKESVVAVNPSVRNDANPPKDWTMGDAFIQPAVMRPGIDTWNLTNPNVPLSNVVPPTTDFADFKRTDQVINPVAGTMTRAVPRTSYSNPKTSAGKSFSTGFTTGKPKLRQWPPPPPEPGFTVIRSVEQSMPQQPYMEMYLTRELGDW